MRFFTFLGWLLVVGLSFGCKKEQEEVAVTLDVVDNWRGGLDATAPPQGPMTVFLPTSRVYSAVVDSCRRHNILLEQLQAATLSQATLTVQASVGQNFDLVRQLTWYITSEQGDRMVLATLPDVPLGFTSLTLTPTNASLLSYLRPGQYYLTPQVEMRQPGQTIAQLQLQLRYRVQGRTR
jgi:hypothetical protein